MPSHVSRPNYSTPKRSRLAFASPAPPSAPAPMEFDKPEMKPAGPVFENYNPRPSAFTRFFERGLNLSGNRRDNRRGDFKFREGPFKGLTLGQAEERAFDLFNNLDPSVKAKYQRMADSKRGFDPRGGMSMGSGQTYNGRYLPNSRFNPNRFTDGAEKTELNDTELDFDNMPSNNNLAQNQSVSTEEAPPSGSPEPPASKPSGGLILNDENPGSAVSSPTMTPAPKNPFTTEQGDKKPAPTSGEGVRNKRNPFLKEDGSFDLDKFMVGRGGPEEAERVRRQAAQQVKANNDDRSLERDLQRERIENADHISGEAGAKKIALMEKQSKERIDRGDFRPLNRRLYKSQLQNQMDDVAEEFGKDSEEYKTLQRKSDRLRGKSINEEYGMFVGERLAQPGFTMKNPGSGTFTDEESAFAREAAFKAANNPRYKNRRRKAENPFPSSYS